MRWLGLLLLLASCSAESPPSTPGAASPSGPAWFEDRATENGVHFTYVSGHSGRYLMPEIIGGGAALLDLEGDGDLDLYLVQGGSIFGDRAAAPTNRLFRNDGKGRFTDVTSGSGAADRGYGMGAAVGDYDGDGDPDLYVTNLGRNTLLRNDGEGRFEDVTDRAGVPCPGWSTSATFLDHDGDGDLDLFVCAYLEWTPALELECFNTMGGTDYCSPRNYLAPAQDTLFLNLGDGTFTDVTEESGLTAFSGTGLGVVSGDFNRDGWVDLFVANDGMRDQLWVNGEGVRFVDRAIDFGCALDADGRAAAGMGVTAEDIDADGDLDLMVCNLRNESDCFFRNEDNAYFLEQAAAVGLASTSRRFTRFGMAWHDFDADGYLDLYQANGRVMKQGRSYTDDPYAEPDLLMRGGPDGRFVPVPLPGGTAAAVAFTGRAAAFGDLDGDGGMDIVVVNRDGPAQLLFNVHPARGHWIAFRVIERGRDAYGARVEIRCGTRTIYREVRAGYSYLASNEPWVRFGLGDVENVDQVRVHWLDGTVQEFGSRDVDRLHPLRRSTP